MIENGLKDYRVHFIRQDLTKDRLVEVCLYSKLPPCFFFFFLFFCFFSVCDIGQVDEKMLDKMDIKDPAARTKILDAIKTLKPKSSDGAAANIAIRTSSSAQKTNDDTGNKDEVSKLVPKPTSTSAEQDSAQALQKIIAEVSRRRNRAFCLPRC